MSEWRMAAAQVDALRDGITYQARNFSGECIERVSVQAAVRLKIVMPVPTEADVERATEKLRFGMSACGDCAAIVRLVAAALGDNERA